MKKTYYYIKHYIDLFRKNKKFKVKLNVWTKIIFLFRGFLSEKYYLYELYKNNYTHYLSDFHVAQSRWINEPYTEILSNKYIFYKVLEGKVCIPQLYGIIINGKYIPEKLTLDKLESLQSFIIKPISGGGGKGILWIKKENNIFYVNQNSYDTFESLKKNILQNLNNYIVCEVMKPGNFSSSLYPYSINTMRILTFIDPTTNEPFVARASQRIGVSQSAPQDNFSKGGLSAKIDLQTGTLSDATTHPFHSKHIRYTHHPETNAPIKGQTIPNWSFIYSEILSLSAQLPMLKVVGWDVLQTDNGICIIEGNHHPDPDVIQCHEPLLTDQRIKLFYKKFKIIK